MPGTLGQRASSSPATTIRNPATRKAKKPTHGMSASTPRTIPAQPSQRATHVPKELFSRVGAHDEFSSFVPIPIGQLSTLVLATAFGTAIVAATGGGVAVPSLRGSRSTGTTLERPRHARGWPGTRYRRLQTVTGNPRSSSHPCGSAGMSGPCRGCIAPQPVNPLKPAVQPTAAPARTSTPCAVWPPGTRPRIDDAHPPHADRDRLAAFSTSTRIPRDLRE